MGVNMNKSKEGKYGEGQTVMKDLSVMVRNSMGMEEEGNEREKGKE